MSSEDLYREMLDREDEDDRRFKQRRAALDSHPVTVRRPNELISIDRYNREIAPVIEARARISAGLPATRNPITNAWLKLTGRDRLKDAEAVDPSKGFTLAGPTTAQVQAEIAANPERFSHLKRKGIEVTRKGAKRRTPEDLHQ